MGGIIRKNRGRHHPFCVAEIDKGFREILQLVVLKKLFMGIIFLSEIRNKRYEIIKPMPLAAQGGIENVFPAHVLLMPAAEADSQLG